MNKKAFTLTGNIRRNAFTLAEVLITLAIIGVVAAITIPTLITNYQKKVYVAKLQKGISVLNQGVKLMMATEGVSRFEDIEANSTACGEKNTGGSGPLFAINTNARECFNSYFSKYFKIVDYNKSLNYQDEDFYKYSSVIFHNGKTGKLFSMMNMGGYYGFRTQDGMIIWPNGFNADAIIDVNGSDEPNEIGKDIFILDRNEFGNYSVSGLDTWDDESNNNDYCGDDKKGNGYGCSGRIMAEGWKMNY